MLYRVVRCSSPVHSTGYSGVFTDGESLYTENLVPNVSVYGERLLQAGDKEFRAWNPRRSKLAALILRGFEHYTLGESSRVLYLGSAQGTTASHVSDIVSSGMVYCVEIAPKAFQKLLRLSEQRKNILPILADARSPETYRALVDKVDLLYQDVAQREQAYIFLKNVPMLSPDGIGVLMVKARSIDVAASPDRVFEGELDTLKSGGLKVLSVTSLEPYQKDHAAVVLYR